MIEGKNISYFVLLPLFIISCCTLPFHKGFQIRIENRTINNINNTGILSAKGFKFPCGVIGSDAEMIYSRVRKFPANDQFTLEWVSHDNRQFRKTIDLSDKVPKRFAGTLVFIIDDNNELVYKIEN